MKTTPLKITSPADILAEAITQAIEPHKAALAAAVKRDVELDAKANAVHPDKIKAEGLTLIGRADDESFAELEKHGGLDGYIQAKAGMYPIYENACKAHAMGCVPLFEALARDLCPAMEAAGAAGEVAVVFGEWHGDVADLKSEAVGSLIKFSAGKDEAAAEAGSGSHEEEGAEVFVAAVQALALEAGELL